MEFDQDDDFYEQLQSKLKAFNLQTDQYVPIGADLYDLTEASHEYIEKMDEFLKLDPENKDEYETLMINLLLTLEHFSFHVNSALPILKKINNEI